MVKVVCVLKQQIDIYFSTVMDIFKWLEILIIYKSSVAIQVVGWMPLSQFVAIFLLQDVALLL